MKKIVLLQIILLIFVKVYSQNDSIWFLKANADISSRYVWRGSDYFNSPCIHPDLQINFDEKFGIGIWGATSFTNQPIQEIDLYLFANYKRLNFYLFDYFYMNTLNNNHYFDFYYKTTGHTLSFDVSYTISEKYPLTILASYNFWGNDTLKSTYLEANYEIKEKKLQIFIGGTLNNGWYSSKAGICNTGIQLIKEIEISPSFKIPLKIQCIVNPIRENIYFVASISI